MDGKIVFLYIRDESDENENRTPLTPSDCLLLSDIGFIIYIKRSVKRVYRDIEYEKVGCFLTDFPWFSKKFKDFYILGIKVPHDLENTREHMHIYFSHALNNQCGAIEHLQLLKNTRSKLYDLEYLLDSNGDRRVYFCLHAGIVGAILGVWEFYLYYKYRISISNLKILRNDIEAIEKFKKLSRNILKTPKIAVIGANGKTGSGVQYVLKTIGFSYKKITRTSPKTNLTNYDIVFNCIKLDDNQREVWVDENTYCEEDWLLIDISCDVNKPNNPFPFYKKCTTWREPVYKKETKRVISISNLPSILPKNSSIFFSEQLTRLFMEKNAETWKNCLSRFSNVVSIL